MHEKDVLFNALKMGFCEEHKSLKSDQSLNSHIPSQGYTLFNLTNSLFNLTNYPSMYYNTFVSPTYRNSS